MMGFGGSGAVGNSSSSISNLSALAPPFRVDRSNTKPNSNPLLHYSESSYMVEPFSHQWQYASPSAPRPEMVIDSTGITSVPVSDDYLFLASAPISPSTTQWSALSPSTKVTGGAFAYGGEVKPYYSPYVPSLVGQDGLLVEEALFKDEGSRYNVVPTSGLSGTSQHDYTQSLYDLEYGPQWVEGLGFDDGKRAERSELDGSFSSGKANVGGSLSYKNQLYQGGHGSENRNKYREDSGALYQNFNQGSEREVHTGSTSTGYMEDKSFDGQNLGFFSYNSNGTFVAASSSPYPESYPSVVSCEVQKNFPHYQNSSSSYENCVRPVDFPFPGPVSVTRSSPTVVIRSPPAANDNFGQVIAFREPACSENVGGVHSVDFDYTNPLKRKGSGPKPISKIKEHSFETDIFNFSKQGNDLFSSTLAKEVSNPLLCRDNSDHKIKARFGSQLPDINISSGFAMAVDNVKIVNSTEDSSDIIDHQNTAVDSPCWKGAPSSLFSSFDVEAGNSNHAKVNLNEPYGFGHEEHQNLHSIVASNRVFSEKVEGNMGNENERARNGVELALERTLDAICSTKEQSLLDGAENNVWTSSMTRSNGVKLSDGRSMPRKESKLPNNLTSVFDMEVSDTKHLTGKEGTGMTVNDVSEGASVAAAVAVHAAEKVLASPASQDDATEHAIVPDPKLNVPAMIKAIHNLSELLLFHLSGDACSVEEENTETLKHVMSNIDACLSKKAIQAQGTHKPEPKNPVGETSDKFQESCNADAISGDPHVKSEVDSHIKFDYLQMHDEERNYSFPGKKYEKSPVVSALRDDLDMTGDDDMAKAIKKILEENLQLNEEMHSDALLFKSLWLEAEAKLCSMSYKARFDRMKNQMEKIKHKAPQENEDITEMLSHVCLPPDLVTISELAPKACDDAFPNPTLQNSSISSTKGHADNNEASVFTRFNILKSREDNMKPINMEDEEPPEMVDCEPAGSIMARFNILKSREDNTKPINTDEEQPPEVVDGEHANSIMARFNILKSREDNMKPINTEEEQQPVAVDCEHEGSIMARFSILKSREEKSKSICIDEERPKMISGEFAGEKYLKPCNLSEDQMLNVTLKPHFLLHQTGGLSGSKFGLYADGAGLEPLNEYHLSIWNDPSARSYESSRMINENNSGSSSSDWEHVLKEDISWKN